MFGDLLRQIYRAPLVLAKALMKSPISFFVYGIMSKWYLMVMLSTIMVTFWVFKGLEKSGVLDATQKVVSKGLADCKSVAQNCTPLMMDLSAMWECIKNPPEYKQTTDEKNMENDTNELMKINEPMGEKTNGESVKQNEPNPYDH